MLMAAMVEIKLVATLGERWEALAALIENAGVPPADPTPHIQPSLGITQTPRMRGIGKLQHCLTA